MNACAQLAIFAISDTQVILGVIGGLVALWVVFRLLKLLAGLFLKLIVVLLVAAAVVWVVWTVA